MDINTVLLVEDDKLFRQMMRESLEEHDFLVLEAAAGKRSIQILEQHAVDIILLDLYLPDGNGLSFIPEMRKFTDVPLIIVSGEEDPAGKINGLDSGADDFVQKPFNIDELIARINANIRRYHDVAAAQKVANDDKSSDKVQFDRWVLDRTKFQIFDGNDDPCDLTLKEFQILDMLVSNSERVVPRADLCEAIREQNYVPTPRAIDVKITRIRKKIGDDAHAPVIIKTVRGVGYMMGCEVNAMQVHRFEKQTSKH